jgi:hypothetical protein
MSRMWQEIEFRLRGRNFGQAAPQGFVNYDFEWPARGMGQFRSAFGEIVVKSESCPHGDIMMPF